MLLAILTVCLPFVAGLNARAASTVTITTITAAPTQPTSEPQYVSDSLFTSAILNSTNFFRYEHNVSALTWNTTLASFATNWVSNCNFSHTGGPYGENLAEGYANATAAVEAWGLERTEYNFGDPGFSEQTGHFTQLVWESTTTVGCGRKYCSNLDGW